MNQTYIKLKTKSHQNQIKNKKRNFIIKYIKKLNKP